MTDKDKEPSAVSFAHHEAEVKRAGQVAGIAVELKHLSEDITDLKETTRLLASSVEGMRTDLGAVTHISDRVAALEATIRPIDSDYRARKGVSRHMNDLGVRAPLLIGVGTIIIMAVAYWLTTKGVVK